MASGAVCELTFYSVRGLKKSAAGVCEICAVRSLSKQESERLVPRAQLRASVHPPCHLLGNRCISNKGHMVHQTATGEVMSAIDLADQKKQAVSVSNRQRQTVGASVT